MSEYCEQQIHIIDAVFSNPHKYSYKERESLIKHIDTCSVCYNFFLEYNTTEEF